MSLKNNRFYDMLPWIAAAIVMYSCFWMIGAYAANLPTGDEWDLARTLLSFHQDGVNREALLAFHNEHRLVVPRLYFYGVSMLAGWNVKLISFVNVLPLTATAWLITHVWGGFLRSKILAVLFTLITGLLLGSWCQWQNIIWSFQFPWFSIPFLFVFSCWILIKSNWPDWLARSTVLVALLAATACMANGLLTWLAILPLWLRGSRTNGHRWLYLATWALGFSLAWVVAIAGSSAAQGGALRQACLHPGQFLLWFFYLLGQPLVGCLVKAAGASYVGEGLGGAAGIAIVFLVTYATYRTIRSNRTSGPVESFAFALGTFGLLSALAITAGRFEGGLAMASQSRYVTFTQFVLLGGLLLIAAQLNENATVLRVRAVTFMSWLGAAALIVLLVIPFYTTQNWLNDLRLAHGRLKAVLALSRFPAVQPELQLLAHTNTVPRFLVLIEELETAGLYCPPRLNVNAVPVGAIAHASAIGNIDVQRTENNSRVFEGWAMLSNRHCASDAVVAAQMTDAEHFRILAVSTDKRFPRQDVVDALHTRRALLSGWRLTIPADSDAKSLFLLSFDATSNRFFRF